MSKNTKLTPEEFERKVEGSYKSLMQQVDKIHRECREKSVETRKTYYNAEKQFCKFLAREFRIVKISNVEARHLYAYVDDMKANGLSPAYMRTLLSGIRFYHDHSGSKKRLPGNEKLDLENRHPGQYNRAWTNEEIEKACEVAANMRGKKRIDVIIAFRIGSNFGLRANEIVGVKICHIEYALQTGQFHVPRGKGGQKRDIPLDMPGQRELLKELLAYAKKRGKNPDDYLLCDNHKNSVYNEKKSLEDWVNNHKDKFQDPDRAEKVEPGKKPRATERLGLHSLRHTYTQNRMRFLRNQGKMSEKAIRKETSESLGHHRIEITRIYEE